MARSRVARLLIGNGPKACFWPPLHADGRRLEHVDDQSTWPLRLFISSSSSQAGRFGVIVRVTLINVFFTGAPALSPGPCALINIPQRERNVLDTTVVLVWGSLLRGLAIFTRVLYDGAPPLTVVVRFHKTTRFFFFSFEKRRA